MYQYALHNYVAEWYFPEIMPNGCQALSTSDVTVESMEQ